MNKGIYILKRLISLVIIALTVSLFVFYVLRISGSDPIITIIGNKQSTEQLRLDYTEEFGLDQPLFKQYLDWVNGIFHGTLGRDWVTKQEIGLQIAEKLPVTLGLVTISSIIGIFFAIILGIISAKFRGKAWDSTISMFMLIVSSIPSFLIGILAIIFCVTYIPTYSFIGSFRTFPEYLNRIMLPSCVMSLNLLAILGRVTRSSMIQQLQAPYMITAKAKGITQKNMIYKHAFHNGVIPVITVAGYMIASSIGSTVLVESVFSLPGIGGMLIDAILQNNYPVVQVLVLILLAVYLVVSFVVDILYTVIDPRVTINS